MGIRFSLLGPVRAWRDGTEVSLGSPQQRGLLAVLLLRRGHVVTAEALIDALWGDEPPPHALGAIRTYVSRLRKVLAPDAPRVAIESQSGGYALRYPPEALDVTRGQQLLAAAAQADEPGQAARLARDALGLWVGEPLAGLPGPFADGQRRRLTELRLSALEQRVGYDLAAGCHDDLVSELPAVVLAYPLRERLVAAHMTALYRAGRAADALRAYHDTRALLAEELGTDPGPELAALYRQILNADPALAAPVPRRRGPVPAQLPADLADFTGQTELVDRLTAALSAPSRTPLVAAVSGIGGAGKTALAVHVGHALRATFPDGQLYVDLHGTDDNPVEPAEVLGRFLRALGVPPESVPEQPSERSALLRSTLADRRILLVLDNARGADQIEPLLPATAGCAVLVTSRALLIDLPATISVELDGFSDADALALLRAVLGEQRVAAEPEAARELVALCAGLPLALRIAAARLAARTGWSIADLTERLRDERNRLDELRLGPLAVESSIRLGYRQLAPAYAWALRMLSVPAAPHLSRHAAAAVLGFEPRVAEDLAEPLVDLHLLASPAPGRYSFHDLVRAATRRQATGAELDQAPRQLLDHYLASGKRLVQLLLPGTTLADHLAYTRTPGEPFDDADRAQRWLADERTGLLDTVVQAVGRPDPPVNMAADLLLSLYDCAELEIGPADVVRVARLVADGAVQAGDRRAEGRVHTFLAALFLGWNQWADAQSECDQARECCAATGDTLVGAIAAQVTGAVSLARGAPDESVKHYRQALTEYRRHRDGDGVATVLVGMAAALGDLGRYPEAVAAGEEARDRFRAASGWHSVVMAMSVLGRVMLQTGDPHAAIRYLREGYDALSLSRDRSRRWPARLSYRLAEAYLDATSPAEAVDAAQRAATLFGELGDGTGRAAALTLLARAHRAMGQETLAEQYEAEARAASTTALTRC